MAVTLHTDIGDLKIELFCEYCPKSCENFLALCASDYYNGCLFHRNIKGFIVQTGDPTHTGKGGNSIWGKKFEDEFKEDLKHSARGIVSMANNGPNTNASQFFVTYAAHPHLDLKYTVFGKVIDGFDTLDELEKLPVNPKNYKPLTETRINNITIHANPLAGGWSTARANCNLLLFKAVGLSTNQCCGNSPNIRMKSLEECLFIGVWLHWSPSYGCSWHISEVVAPAF